VTLFGRGNVLVKCEEEDHHYNYDMRATQREGTITTADIQARLPPLPHCCFPSSDSSHQLLFLLRPKLAESLIFLQTSDRRP